MKYYKGLLSLEKVKQWGEVVCSKLQEELGVEEA